MQYGLLRTVIREFLVPRPESRYNEVLRLDIKRKDKSVHGHYVVVRFDARDVGYLVGVRARFYYRGGSGIGIVNARYALAAHSEHKSEVGKSHLDVTGRRAFCRGHSEILCDGVRKIYLVLNLKQCGGGTVYRVIERKRRRLVFPAPVGLSFVHL